MADSLGRGNWPGTPPGRVLVPSGAAGQAGMLAALCLLMFGVFALLFFLAYQPDPLKDVDGYRASPGTKTRNLKSLVAIGLSSGRDLTLTEAELNGFLAATLETRQAGPLSGKASMRGVAIRLKDGSFDLVFERTLFGRAHTVSVNMVPTIETVGGGSRWNVQPAGGKFGKLPVAGALVQMILKPVYQIGSAYSSELDILRYASSVRVEDGRVLLGPVTVRQ